MSRLYRYSSCFENRRRLSADASRRGCGLEVCADACPASALRVFSCAIFGSLVLLTLFCLPVTAEEGNAGKESAESLAWSSFRGGGSSSVGAEASIPKIWSATAGIAWQVDVPGYGQSSPLVSGDKVFVTSVEGLMKERNLVVCVDRVSGQQIWKHEHLTTLQGPSNYMYSRTAPKPASDVEHYHKSGGHGSHGGASHGDGLGKPGGSMLAGMLKRDVDGDGKHSEDEIPSRLNAVMQNIDLNKDGSLDKDELKKMAERFAAKRKNSRDSSRAPIVYGVAADSNGIIVRTGTRLFAIGGDSSNE